MDAFWPLFPVTYAMFMYTLRLINYEKYLDDSGQNFKKL